MKISRVGEDLAKNVFQLHGVDRHGKTFLKRRLSRDVNGGGYADLIVGAYLDDNNGSGSARIFSSSDLMNDSDLDCHINGVDNCPTVPNYDQSDSDDDVYGDACQFNGCFGFQCAN